MSDQRDDVKVERAFGDENVYIYKGRRYDERSALHNGIIGPGATLFKMIQEGVSAQQEQEEKLP